MENKINILIEVLAKNQDAIKKINTDLSTLSKNSKTWSDSFRSTGETIQGIGSKLMPVSLGVAGLGGSMLKAASDFDVAESKYKILLGDMDQATKRVGELKKYAAATPFDLQGIIEADQLLEGFGIRSEDMLKTVGNAAAMTTGNMGDLSMILGQLSQNKGLENIRQLVERGVVSLDELREAGIRFAKDDSIINSTEETFETVVDIMKSKFEGGTDELAKTIPGKWSTFKDTIINTLADIGESSGLVQNVKDFLDKATEAAEKLGEAFKNLSPETKKALVVIGGLVVVAGPLLWILGGMISVLAPIGTAFAALTSPIGLVIVGVTALAAGTIWLMDQFGLLQPIVDTVKQGFETLKNTWETFKQAWNSDEVQGKLSELEAKFVEFKARLEPTLNTLSEAVGNLFKSIFGEGTDSLVSFDTAVYVLVTTMDAIALVIEKITPWIQGFLDLLTVGVDAVTWFVNEAQRMEGTMASIGASTTSLRVMWEENWDKIIFDLLPKYFGEWLRQESNRLVEMQLWGTQMSQAMANTVNQMVSSAGQKLVELQQVFYKKMNEIQALVSVAAGQILRAFHGIDLTSVGYAILQGLAVGMLRAQASVLSTVNGIATRITNSFKAGFAIKSPSRKMMTVGDYVMEGLRVGMENNMGPIDDLVRDVVGKLDFRKNLNKEDFEVNKDGSLTVRAGAREKLGTDFVMFEDYSTQIRNLSQGLIFSGEELSDGSFRVTKAYDEHTKEVIAMAKTIEEYNSVIVGDIRKLNGGHIAADQEKLRGNFLKDFFGVGKTEEDMKGHGLFGEFMAMAGTISDGVVNIHNRFKNWNAQVTLLEDGTAVLDNATKSWAEIADIQSDGSVAIVDAANNWVLAGHLLEDGMVKITSVIEDFTRATTMKTAKVANDVANFFSGVTSAVKKGVEDEGTKAKDDIKKEKKEVAEEKEGVCNSFQKVTHTLYDISTGLKETSNAFLDKAGETIKNTSGMFDSNGGLKQASGWANLGLKDLMRGKHNFSFINPGNVVGSRTLEDKADKIYRTKMKFGGGGSFGGFIDTTSRDFKEAYRLWGTLDNLSSAGYKTTENLSNVSLKPEMLEKRKMFDEKFTKDGAINLNVSIGEVKNDVDANRLLQEMMSSLRRINLGVY